MLYLRESWMQSMCLIHIVSVLFKLSKYKNQLEAMKMNNNQFINEGTNIIECSRQAYKMYKQQTTAEKRRLLDVMFEKMTVKNRIINYTYKKFTSNQMIKKGKIKYFINMKNLLIYQKY